MGAKKAGSSKSASKKIKTASQIKAVARKCRSQKDLPITEPAELEKDEEARTFLANITEYAADAIIGLDMDTNIISWNSGAAMLFGYSAQEIIGKPWSLVIPKESANECRERFRKATIDGFVKNVETIRVAKDGRQFPAEMTLTALKDKSGEHIGFVSIIRDSTERKLAEEEIQAACENYAAIINLIDGIVWEADPRTFQFSFVSRQAERLLGYPVEQWVNIPTFWRDHIHTDDREWVLDYCTSAVAEKRPHEFEYRMVAADGRTVWLRNIVTVAIKNNQAVKARGIMIDITEHKRLLEQLQHSQKMEAVGQLVGGIAHDFNNVLTAIVGFATLLQLKIEKDSPLRDYAGQILEVSDRAANLTRSLLTFSRRQILNPRPLILHQIIEAIATLLIRIIRENIEIKTILIEDPLTIMADAGQIGQVLINLATNAQDAMPDGGRLTIETGITKIDESFIKAHGYGKTGTYALISVLDTGIGMDEKTRERIFEPFFTTKEAGKGTGLGLAIVYGIVKEHNGYITVYSETGKGATFKIYLPLVVAEVGEVKSVEDIAPIGGTETILLAEDDINVRNLTRIVLEEHGYAVIAASDGQEAVDRFKENKDKIHLSLLDVIMPKKNGKEVHDEIKKISPDTKALFMSGYTAGVIKKKKVVEEGLNIIFKPISPVELLRKIREVLEK